MIEKIKNLFSTNRRPASIELVGVVFREFSPIVFIWTDPISSLELPLRVTFCVMRTYRNSITEVELNIDQEGFRVQACITYTSERLHIYLGNNFLVPATLRRRGLALAALVATAETIQYALTGETDPDQPIKLEGQFVNDGAYFARSVCDTIPYKGQSANMNPEKLDKARSQLTLKTKPTLISERTHFQRTLPEA